jgi:hypothetical protein
MFKSLTTVREQDFTKPGPGPRLFILGGLNGRVNHDAGAQSG